MKMAKLKVHYYVDEGGGMTLTGTGQTVSEQKTD